MPDELPQSSLDPIPAVPKELAGIVRAGVRASELVHGSVAVGGTVCSLYAGHRQSLDIDFVIKDLIPRFEEVRELLQAVPDWRVQKTTPPVLILGKLGQVPIGYRQLRRSASLETTELLTPDGPLTIPRFDEMLRIKAFLACDRNYVRDFLDFAELSCMVPRKRVIDAMAVLDKKIAWEKRPAVALEVIKALAVCQPRDGDAVVFDSFRFLNPRVTSWEQIQKICREISADLSFRLLGA